MIKICSAKQFEERFIKSRILDRGKTSAEVAAIIDDIKKEGDKALLEYEKRFGNSVLIEKNLQVNESEIKEAFKSVDKKTIMALKTAHKIIKGFYKSQLPRQYALKFNGIEIRQIIRPVRRVGCYIPGGVAPLVSTVLMTVTPAMVAGAEEIFMCTPSRYGKINHALIVAAKIAGGDKIRIFRAGGAQAIAAMAYGTKTIPKVDKIFGPGNIYVTEAKRQVYGDSGIDFLAGPSEILIIADGNSNPEFIAADMLAQAEHDERACPLLITPSGALAMNVQKRITERAKKLPRKLLIEKALSNGAIILVKNLEQGLNLANEFAPEHLELMADEKYLGKIDSAGEIFLGSYSCVAIGDYVTGSHVLPTGGFAKARGGLNVADFLKIITTQKVSKKGLKKVKGTAIALARAESMEAHINSINARFGD